ncbi:MAG: lactate utilization protein [Deltaproteobacteria bacterium]|jgi:hypothetical protein|nr:lactate utilization protein [Deltaproteobacteria bacterium]
MSQAREKHYQLQLAQVQKALEKHFFGASVHETLEEALDYLTGTIVDESVASVGFGGSETVTPTDINSRLLKNPRLTVFDRNSSALSPEERSELSRKSLTADLFIASSNAVTLSGELVNIDKFGNRVAAMIYGPKKVALIAGRNKIVPTQEDARMRLKNYAAPMNAIRLNLTTPCAVKGFCHDCQGSSRICGVLTIIERSFPPGRIHVLLVNQDLGF